MNTSANKLVTFGTVCVSEITNPFNPLKDIKRSVTLEGRALSEYVDTTSDNIITLNGEIVEDFSVIVPINSMIITVPYVAGGGGGSKNILAMVAMIALTVFTAGIAGAALAAMNVAQGAFLFGGALGLTAMGAMSAAVMIGGSMLIGAAFKQDMPNLPSLGGAGSQASPTYSWRGITTSTEANRPIPVLYGEAWVGGQAINKYVTYDGTDEWLNIQLALCHGEIYEVNQSDIYINGNPFTNYAFYESGTEIVTTARLDQRSGAFDQTIMEGFGDSVFLNNIGVPVTSATPVTELTTSTNINKIKVHIAFPNGIYNLNAKTGAKFAKEVQFKIHYKKPTESEAEWKTIFDVPEAFENVTTIWKSSYIAPFGTYIPPTFYPTAEDYFDAFGSYPVESYFTQKITRTEYIEAIATIRINGSSETPIRRVYESKEIPYGQYQIRITRITADGSLPYVSDAMVFNHMEEINTADVNYGGIALLGIKIKATDQLSSEPNFTIKVSRKPITIDGIDRKTNNPANAVLDMLTNPHYGGRLPLSRVDEDSINEWKNFCDSGYDATLAFTEADTSGVNGWKGGFDGYLHDISLSFSTLVIPENINELDIFATFSATIDYYENGVFVKTFEFTKDDIIGAQYWVQAATGGKFLQVDLKVKQISDYGISTKSFNVTNLDATAYTEDYYNANILKFNGVLDVQSNLWDSMQKVAKVGRGQMVIKGTKYSAIADKPTLPTQLFNDANILDDSFSVNYIGIEDIASEVEIQFADDDIRGEMNQINVVDTAINSSQLSPKKATVQLIGCTNKIQAVTFGKYLLANNKYIKRTMNFKASIDSMACTVGDVVGISNSIPQWGVGGRVVNTTATTITFDKQVTTELGKTYKIRVRNSLTDVIDILEVINVINETTDTLDVASHSAVIDDIYSVGEYSTGTDDILYARIIDISRDGDQERSITAIEYNESILDFDYDNDMLNVISPVQKPFVRLSDLVITESLIKLKDKTIVTRINLNWNSTAVEPITYEIYYGKQEFVDNVRVITETKKMGEVQSTSYSFDYVEVIDAATPLYFTVKQKDKTGREVSATYTVLGKTAKPADITDITSSSSNGTLRITWKENIEVDFLKYIIIVAGVTYQLTANSLDVASLDKGTYDVVLIAEDTSGNQSTPIEYVATVTEPSLAYSIANTYLIEKAFLDGVMVIFFGVNADKTTATAYDLWKVTLGDLTVDEFTFHSQQLDGLTFDDFGTTHTYRFLDNYGDWQVCNLDQLLVIQRLLGHVTANAVADGNVRVFNVEPFTPYSQGDLWIDGNTVKTCELGVNKLTGAYLSTDWDGITNPKERVSFASNVSSITTTPETLQAGLILTNQYMGFSDGASMQSYIKADGTFKFNGDSTHSIEWNGTSLDISGSVVVKDDGGQPFFINKYINIPYLYNPSEIIQDFHLVEDSGVFKYSYYGAPLYRYVKTIDLSYQELTSSDGLINTSNNGKFTQSFFTNVYKQGISIYTLNEYAAYFNGGIYSDKVEATTIQESGVLLSSKYEQKRVTVPTTATSTGEIGQIAYDANYIYVCTATNTWKRTLLSTW